MYIDRETSSILFFTIIHSDGSVWPIVAGNHDLKRFIQADNEADRDAILEAIIIRMNDRVVTVKGNAVLT